MMFSDLHEYFAPFYSKLAKKTTLNRSKYITWSFIYSIYKEALTNNAFWGNINSNL